MLFPLEPQSDTTYKFFILWKINSLQGVGEGRDPNQKEDRNACCDNQMMNRSPGSRGKTCL